MLWFYFSRLHQLRSGRVPMVRQQRWTHHTPSGLSSWETSTTVSTWNTWRRMRGWMCYSHSNTLSMYVSPTTQTHCQCMFHLPLKHFVYITYHSNTQCMYHLPLKHTINISITYLWVLIPVWSWLESHQWERKRLSINKSYSTPVSLTDWCIMILFLKKRKIGNINQCNV